MPRKYAAYGKLLKYYRELGNLKIHPPWTQTRIAKALGVSLRTYAGWENGESQPSSDDLRNFVAVLELSEEEEKNLYRSKAQIPPEINNLPFQRNPFFTGREEHLKQLRKKLQETGTAAITQSISISGLGGIGKTQLALEYAHCHYPNDYRVALWVDADKETLQASYASLSETLGLDAHHEQELGRRVQAVKQWLATHTNWLLIMDNSDDLPLALSFLPAKPLGYVILTTRSQIVRDSNIASQIQVEEMETEKGLLFLLRRSGVLEDDAELPTDATDILKPALQLVELLGGHPLAIDQAGAYIEGTGISFTDYIKRYHTERYRLLKRRGSQVSKYNYHPEPVAATLELSFKMACEQYPLASDILHFCAFLHPDAIPEELFQYDDSFKFGTTAFDDGIEALRRYSLINQNLQKKTFSIHRLVQAVLIDAMSPDLQKQWRERVVRALIAAFPEVELKGWGSYSEESIWGRLLPHVLPCATWTEYELTPTVGVAKLFHRAASYQRELGQYSVAETLLVRALSILEEQLGAEYPYAVISPHIFAILDTAMTILDIAMSLRLLGVVNFGRGNYEQAESLLERALSIQLRHLGTEHPDVAGSLFYLASLYHEQGNYEQAELLYRRGFKIMEQYLEAELDIAPTLYGLTRLLYEQGKHEQTEALLQYALSIQEQRLGATHRHTQSTRSHYADFLHRVGRDTEAAALEVNVDPPVIVGNYAYVQKFSHFE